ncbi:hypothetical protein L6164_001852 [Bauhinia variegata]|uniref:Uncharacterized protein n=1 Tax=Bauhinia variegata TaxID=167791 RepID=A0ACB9QAT9_BAUVA|nr:hypothetical protein L6164_001852 [Bauhinia variegata]
MVLSLIHFRYKMVDGSPVPTIIFQDNPSLFHGFKLSLNFSFFGSFTSLTLQHMYPKLSKCCQLLAVVSTTTEFIILVRHPTHMLQISEELSDCQNLLVQLPAAQ